MKVGVVLPLFSGDPGKVIDAARETEDLGFDGAFVFDHFFPPGAPRDRPALEAFTTLAAVAAATERIAVGTLVTRISLRPAGMLAKLGAWLDTASGGRLILGMGTGDPIDRPEHEAYGIRLPGRQERRAHLEETIVAVKALWRGERYEGGRLVPPLEGPVVPPPARAGGPPVWLGAQADEVVRIAGRWADGWNGWGLGPQPFRKKADLLAEEAARGGRRAEATWAGIVLAGADQVELKDLSERRRARGLDDEAWTGTTEELTAHLRELEAAGATWAVMVVAGPADRRELIAKQVLPALAQ
ncbi:MAG TPA: LLM class flavin-dependent oxidoreductase [Actinomycetota bacterium]|nr:LLM class flavin-dependent oxidoreductase [Actinomycetota bacterium]